MFLPEPCANCDAGIACPEHDTSAPWSDSWIHPRDRKHSTTNNN